MCHAQVGTSAESIAEERQGQRGAGVEEEGRFGGRQEGHAQDKGKAKAVDTANLVGWGACTDSDVDDNSIPMDLEDDVVYMDVDKTDDMLMDVD